MASNIALRKIAVRAGSVTVMAAWVLFPAVVFGQARSGFEMRPASPWTFRVSAGPAVAGADGSHGGAQLHLAIERTITGAWSVRVQSRTLRTRYDPAANPTPVTSTTQLEFGVAMVKIVKPSELTHAYVGAGASFLSTSFGGIVAPRNKALGVLGLVGLEFHPASRRWGAFAEVFLQGRQMPPELANGQVFMNQIGIAFGAGIPVHRRDRDR